MSYEQLRDHITTIKRKLADLEYSQQYAEAKDKQDTDDSDTPVFGPPPDHPPIMIDRAAIEKKFECVDQLFEPFLNLPDPRAFDPVLQSLVAALQDLSPGISGPDQSKFPNISANGTLDKITNTASGYIQGWSGQAAINFKENFVDHFGTVVKNQFSALYVMWGVIETDRDLWSRARSDIDKIAHSTMDALDNADSCGKNEATFAFAMLGTFATFLTFATAGAASALALSALSLTASVGGTAINGASVGGATADQILAGLKKSIGDLKGLVEDMEHQIASRTQDSASRIQSEKYMISARPKLDDMKGSDATGDAGLGERY